jgi:hypothetical protein
MPYWLPPAVLAGGSVGCPLCVGFNQEGKGTTSGGQGAPAERLRGESLMSVGEGDEEASERMGLRWGRTTAWTPRGL